ncbi:MAG TPA: PAS domain-containing protein [Balneolaceae bacterium]|nr:PAS domain-containing protein [Balneolaceae bacterium]
MKHLDPDILRKLCKDEQSFDELKKLVGNIIKERDRQAEQLALLEEAISSDFDGILITELGLDEPGPKIVYANDGFCGITGYSKDEIIGKTPRIFQGLKTDHDVLDKLKKRLSEGKPFFGKTINYRKDESEFVNQWDIHPMTNDEGRITHWVSYHHDISGRKLLNDGVSDAQMDFDSPHEEANRTVVDVDLKGNIVKANQAFRDLIGYGKDELNNIKIWQLFPKKHMETLKGRFEGDGDTAFFGGQEFKGIAKHKNGLLIQVKGKTSIIEQKGQQLIRAEIKSLSLQKRLIKTLKKHMNAHFS